MFQVLSLFALVVSSPVVDIQETAIPFAGKIEYEVQSGGTEWRFVYWVDGPLWRSELWAGPQLYEKRLGNRETGEAFLINDGGKSYRRLGHPAGGGLGGPPGGPPPRKQKAKKEKPIDLDKTVHRTGRNRELFGRSSAHFEVKGSGKKMEVWAGEELGIFSFHALPRLQAIDDKSRELQAFFDDQPRLPLLLELPGVKGKKSFRMEAKSVQAMDLDPSDLSLPDGYDQEMQGPGSGPPPGGGGRPGGGPPRGGPPPGF